MFQNAFGKTYVDSSSSPCRRCRRCAWEIKSLNLQNEVASTTNWHTIYQTYKDQSFFNMSIQNHVLHGCDHWRPETFSFFSTGYFPFLNLPTNLGVWWITQEWATRPFWVKNIVVSLYPGPRNLLNIAKISEKYLQVWIPIKWIEILILCCCLGVLW